AASPTLSAISGRRAAGRPARPPRWAQAQRRMASSSRASGAARESGQVSVQGQAGRPCVAMVGSPCRATQADACDNHSQVIPCNRPVQRPGRASS
ncbi:hypothetical protein HMPREF0731_2827, partial [Pseudoroseomonas cervicalis ATCC 49957]